MPEQPQRLGPTVTGVARIAFARESYDRRALGDLALVPTGAKVILDVGVRTTIPATTLDLLGRHLDRVQFEVQGSAPAINAWIGALRSRTTEPGWW